MSFITQKNILFQLRYSLAPKYVLSEDFARLASGTFAAASGRLTALQFAVECGILPHELTNPRSFSTCFIQNGQLCSTFAKRAGEKS